MPTCPSTGGGTSQTPHPVPFIPASQDSARMVSPSAQGLPQPHQGHSPPIRVGSMAGSAPCTVTPGVWSGLGAHLAHRSPGAWCLGLGARPDPIALEGGARSQHSYPAFELTTCWASPHTRGPAQGTSPRTGPTHADPKPVGPGPCHFYNRSARSFHCHSHVTLSNTTQ